MKPYYEQKGVQIFHGDCREILPALGPFETCITDPPYGLEFMGKGWDRGVPGIEFWKIIADALRPGSMCLAFGGTRTFHRLTCAIEDAGFEIRDCLSWLYGSGFPKSMDISKAIDKAAGVERSIISSRTEHNICRPKGGGDERLMVSRGNRETREVHETEATTAEAKQWAGWGTALKPAHEEIIMARKPLAPGGELRYIVESLTVLEARLCLLLSDARLAALASPSSPNVQQLLASAQWTADERSATRGALSETMDMSRFASAIPSCLNIVSSWRNIWAVLCEKGNTSIIATETNPTIDLATLSYCLYRITPDTIIAAEMQADGSGCLADPAVRYFHAASANIESTLTLSVLGPAMSSEAAGSRAKGEKLRPDWLPIALAMKPTDGTFAENAKKHGVAGINVDGGRITTPETLTRKLGKTTTSDSGWKSTNRSTIAGKNGGRFPANLILDKEAAKALDLQSGDLRSGANPTRRGAPKHKNAYGEFEGQEKCTAHRGTDSGGASRFFYTAKASNQDRNEGYDVRNNHPTVKPIDLMRYLCTLTATPTGGTVLDPFMGSGSTLVAARSVGRPVIGIELEEKYCEIAAKRLAQGLLFT